MAASHQPLPDFLIEAFDSGRVLNGRGERVPMHSNVSIDEAGLLYGLVREIAPAVSVEIGFAQGISTLAILKAHADNGRSGVHHVIDPFQAQYEDAGLAMVRAAGLEPWMRFHRRFAEEVVPGLPRVQFALVDASHLFDLTLTEFVLIDKRLDVGGAVAFHDMWMPALQKTLRYILANRCYELRREPAPGETTAGPRRGATLKSIIARVFSLVPAARQIFTDETLHPWSTLGVPNLAVLRKVADDTRDWRFHRAF